MSYIETLLSSNCTDGSYTHLLQLSANVGMSTKSDKYPVRANRFSQSHEAGSCGTVFIDARGRLIIEGQKSFLKTQKTLIHVWCGIRQGPEIKVTCGRFDTAQVVCYEMKELWTFMPMIEQFTETPLRPAMLHVPLPLSYCHTPPGGSTIGAPIAG